MVESNPWRVLIPAGVISERIDNIARDVQYYIDSSTTPIVLAFVAQGGLWFGMQLVTRLNPESYRWGIVGTSSYDGGESGGKVDLTFNRTGDVEGHRVLLVDDIGDRRKTLEYLKDLFLGPERATEIKTCVLLNKPSRREAAIPLDFVGFNIPDTFVSGCGLDGGENFAYTRNYSEVMFRPETLRGKELYWLPDSLPA